MFSWMEMRGATMFSWMDWYALLKKYTEREGNCLVPRSHIEEGKNLGRWVDAQRQTFKTGAMMVRQNELLDELGFCYDVYESKWLMRYNELKSYMKEHGHGFVPKGATTKRLYRWIKNQRMSRKQMPPHRKKLLDEIEFIWDVRTHRWESFYNLLQRFAEREGHYDVPARHKEDGELLGKWCANQKRLNKEGKLTQERYQKLKDLGVEW